MCTESKRWFNVLIVNAAGERIKVRQSAHSKWHAVELVYTKHRALQPDRKKYKVLTKGLS